MPRRHPDDELSGSPGFGHAQMTNLGRQIRKLRERRGWALKDLSQASNVSVTALQRLEKGDTNPGLLTLVGVLDAFGVSLDHVIRLAREGSGSVQIVRARDGSQRARFVEQTVGEIANGQLRARLLALPPQTDMVAPDRREGGAHFGFVIEGKVRIVLDDDGTQELSAGDAIHAIEPSLRLLSNRTSRPARLLWIDDARLAPPRPH
jgi:transcriptional regulator with XRE-family HTH domain